MFRKLLAAAVLSTAALGAVVVPSVASAQVYIQTAPPPLRVEPVPAPRRGHVWVPGHWQWRGHRHVWVPGTWIVARREPAMHRACRSGGPSWRPSSSGWASP